MRDDLVRQRTDARNAGFYSSLKGAEQFKGPRRLES